jgi:tetratricopeptide (TPR) repeat protein
LLQSSGEASAARDLPGPLNGFRSNAKLGDFEAAFKHAESLLKTGLSQDTIDGLILAPAPQEVPETLEALKNFGAAHKKSAWAPFLRAWLLSNSGRGDEALRETADFARLPARYQWMRYKRGELLLVNRRDYQGAIKEYRAVLDCVPDFWRIRAALAETELCAGKTEAALKRLDALVKEMPRESNGWGLAARGRMLLWIGRLAPALADLDAAVEAGSTAARGHRGAALLLTGKNEAGEKDLDAAAEAAPSDAEVLTWRGEARRLRGDHQNALADFSAARRSAGGNPFWALANSALSKGAVNDAHGMWTDFQSIRRDVLDAFEAAAKNKAGSPADTAAMKRVLEAGLALGGGVRVSNEYLFPLWKKKT